MSKSSTPAGTYKLGPWSLRAGQPLYHVSRKPVGDRVEFKLLVTNLVEVKRGGWVRLRDIQSGQEWSERPRAFLARGSARTILEAFAAATRRILQTYIVYNDFDEAAMLGDFGGLIALYVHVFGHAPEILVTWRPNR